MRAVILLAVTFVVAATGCGGTSGAGEADSAEVRTPQQALDLEQVEQFARIDLPDSAEEVRYQSASAADTSIYLSFAIPAQDYEAFLAGAAFSAAPEPDHDAMQVGAGEDLGWRLDDIERFAGHEERTDGLVRQLLVDLDDPDRPVVYLHAFTT